MYTKSNDMNFEIRIEKECPPDWNKNLLNSLMGNIFNTYQYSEYAKRRLNWQPSFMSLISNNGKILSQVILFEYTRSKIGKKIPPSLNKFALKISNTIKWIYGPVIFSDDQGIINYFLGYVKKKGKKLDGLIHPFYNGNIDTKGIKTEKWSTYIINLQQTKESLLSNLDKHSARKNIERSIERGVQVREVNENSIPEYHDLLNKFRITSGNKPFHYEDTYELWNLLKSVGFKGLLASKDGVNLGGIMFSFFNGYINEWGIARSQQDTDEKLYSQDLLKWKIIDWAVENNQKFYDLSGFNPRPSSEKEEGILRYKRKWGGKQYDFWLVRK